MRRFIFEDLLAALEAAANDATLTEDDLPGVARQMMVDRFGPECSAWLVKKHRGSVVEPRLLHKSGAFDIIVPERDRAGKPYEMPMWFALAVAFLKRRRDWSVDVLSQRGARRFRFRWHAHRRYSPASALRRLGT